MNLNGLTAAPYTPFRPDGTLNLDLVPQLSAHLRSSGVIGAFVAGTTGEGISMTTVERKALLAQWVMDARGLKIVAHVGHNSVADSIDLARHAQACGADCIAAAMPSFLRPNRTSIVGICASIAEAAPKLPFYYYHVPVFTGVQVSIASILPELSSRIPNFGGVKYTHEDLFDYSQSVACAEGKEILWGRDEILLSALVMGAKGAVGSTYNFAGPLTIGSSSPSMPGTCCKPVLNSFLHRR